MSEDKPRWEKPTAEPLGALAQGSGLCNGGNSDADACLAGNANRDYCIAGGLDS